MVSSMLHWAGDMVAIIEVLVRPPKESCKMRVNLLSLETVDFPSTSNSKTRLKGLPVRDVRSMFYQGGDDPSKGEKALVDVASLSRSLVYSTRSPNILATSQINLQDETNLS